ncbi:serine hydrolase domain-containing protein [Deinococcus yavapaiensis]|uniref:CubicO group peptidase (Beta-lactamase class C family) n=1 Tax=Deinococcus yavapaiensis KR-236 TaxID=694435 RepID=A0A318SBF1_9DEIO|nr:serine hydrolase domain-containing protein [Deinococcus yavapaiensis]PYE54057.1 CubicO group peptidase (beta-lactamase class C family) [Deinococcus yavapaiensis KR-236]
MTPSALLTPDRSDLDRQLDRLRVQHGVPGLAWGVTNLDGPQLLGASGRRHVDRDDPLGVHDRLHLGSCTKPITATLLATLVPDVLTWETRVTDVFEGVHDAYRDVTLTHLLTHTSGLPPFTQDEEFQLAPTRETPREARDAFAAWVLTLEPVAPLGSYAYSNAGFGVAAALAERVTRQAWETLMLDRVFRPLDLRSAGFGWPVEVGPNEPWGHRWKGDRWAPHDPRDGYRLHAGIAPAGDVHLSLADGLTFARDHLRGQCGHPGLLPAEAYTVMHEPLNADRNAGLGWGVQRYGPNSVKRASSHNGSAETFFAVILLLPDDDHAFFLATNAADTAGHEAVNQALGILVPAFTGAHVG